MSNSRTNRESMHKRLFDAVDALNKSIFRKEDTYRQLQIELKQSEQDYDKAVGNLKSASDSAERGELAALHDKEIDLQKDLQSLSNEIRSIEGHVKQIEKAISDLANDKDQLDREINERPILISPDLADFLASISDQYEQSSKFSKSINDLWYNSDYWEHDAIQGVQVPIG